MYGWDLDYKRSVHLFFRCWCEKGVTRDLAENVCVFVCVCVLSQRTAFSALTLLVGNFEKNR